ncbi:hypothetical protein FRB90_000416 [Tulasnella sp. 427]|nr:hypothetical protein FRB90_000416 [Tulasnella sp. 427]
MQLSLLTLLAVITAAFAAPVSFSGSLPARSLPAGSGFPAPPNASDAPNSLPPPGPFGTFSFPPPSGTPPARPSGAAPSGAPPSGAPPSVSPLPTQSA